VEEVEAVEVDVLEVEAEVVTEKCEVLEVV
jgi:hypothetical protein